MKEKIKKMHKYSDQIEVRVRGIIFKDDKILVLQEKGKDYYHFPGGHVEFGEELSETLIRELKEELDLKIKNYKLIGAVDNIYNALNSKHHEINFVFHVETENLPNDSNESQIKLIIIDLKKLSSTNVLPHSMRDSIIQWKKDGKFFWITSDINGVTQKHF